MPLVKITRSRQVTIPKELFEALTLQQGDYVEVIRKGNQLILRPQSIVNRDRAQAQAELETLIKEIWAHNKDLDPKEVEREVALAIKEVRKAHARAKSAPQPK